MSGFSLNPDEDMKWIYDQSRPEYYSDQAKHLRDARAAALRACPMWMLDEAARRHASRDCQPKFARAS